MRTPPFLIFQILFNRKQIEMIEIKLANGATLKSEKGEEIYHFYRSEGKSIVPPQKKEQTQK